MGEVYRATDTRLGRDVALKVLRAGMASDAERRERFRREVRALAALDHPAIVGIYSVEETGGVYFLTMPLLEGERLDQCIPEGGLPLDRLLGIGIALAAALSAAHEKSIIHRDLKPANVIITKQGAVKVLDFGLAKVGGRDGEESFDSGLSTEARTREGAVMGTIPYMSPEQVNGETVDLRTDIFSLGILLYEMSTGQRPFRGRSFADVASAILRDAPPSLTSIRSDLPARLQTVIEACLKKDAADRPQTAAEVQSTLATILNTGAAPIPTSRGSGEEPSIVVLPFASLSPDPNDEYFADGVSEEILDALAHIPGLRVAGRGSAFALKGKNEDLRQVGIKLRVSTILEGTLRRAGNRLRITAHLIDAGSGYQIWTERYDWVLEDVFAVQDEIASAIAGRLRLSLAGAGIRGGPPPTRHLGAYEWYLKGRILLYQRGPSIPKALACFTEAVTLDPNYAQAWAGLADGYTTSGYSGYEPGSKVMPRALEAARRALELEHGLAEAHNAVACATLLYERNYLLAEQEFLELLVSPRPSTGWAWYGLFFLLLVGGREPEAREQIALLFDLDRLSAYANVILAFVDFATRRFPEAVKHAQRGVELDPVTRDSGCDPLVRHGGETGRVKSGRAGRRCAAPRRAHLRR